MITGEIVDLPDPPMNIEGVFWSLLFWLIWGGFFLGAVFFEPSKAWWPGMVIGVLIG